MVYKKSWYKSKIHPKSSESQKFISNFGVSPRFTDKSSEYQSLQ